MTDTRMAPAAAHTRPPASARELRAQLRALEDRSRRAVGDLEASRESLARQAGESSGAERVWYRLQLRLEVMRQAMAIESERAARAALAELGDG